MSVDSRPLLTVDGVSVSAGNAVLLHEVSFTLAAGEVLAVLGANGAGKSTLLMTLAGELTAAAGSIDFDGIPLSRWATTALASRRALNASEPPVPFSLTVADYVALGRPFAPVDDPALTEALAECHAGDWPRRDYATLSMGEQTRVQLARSLYQLGEAGLRARCLWLLDEPCAHLDIAQRRFVLALVARVAKAQGWGVVLSTHDPAEAAQIASHALLLRSGRVLAVAPVADALTEANLSVCYGANVARHPSFVVG